MSNYTILIIDYEPKSIERVRRPLAEVGYKVDVATDGLSGIETFHRIKPDLVMIEAMIPKKHGFEVCQEIKKTPHGKRTPVIIMTSVYKGRKYRSQAFHLHGCDEYIEKPIGEQQIVQVCRRMLGDAKAAVAGQDGPASTDVFELDPMHSPESPVATPFSLPTMEADEDELEIMARLDSILPGGNGGRPSDIAVATAATSRGAGHSPVMASAADTAPPESSISRFDPLPLEEGTRSVPIAMERVAEQDIQGSQTAQEAPSGEWPVEGGPDHVVQFESGRSRKKGKKRSVSSAVGGGHASVALATSAIDVLEEKPARTQAVARLDPETETQPMTVKALKPVVGQTEPDILYEPELQTRPWWLSFAVALALIGAAGALVYLYLGGMFGGGPN